MNVQSIKESLLEQLRIKGATMDHYTSLVDDYIALWEIKENLIADIKERGVACVWNNGGGQSGVKKNDSVSELVRVNAQMLKILSDLGIRGADIKESDVNVPL